MKISPLFICIGRILFPFMLIFGFYIIINGHVSPGGGFQGGAILATAVLTSNYIYPRKISNLNSLIKLEKLSFILILIISSLSFFTRNAYFTNFVPLEGSIDFKKAFLITLNFLIGIKVALGFVTIFSTFIKEGES